MKPIAYLEVCRFKLDEASGDFDAWLLGIAIELNATSGFAAQLTRGEVRIIAKSVGAWTWKHFSLERLAEIQRARANIRWAGHVSLEKSQPWKAEGISRATLVSTAQGRAPR